MDERPSRPAAPLGFFVVGAVILASVIVIIGMGIINTFVADLPIMQDSNTCVADTVLQADGSCAPQE